MWMEDVRIAAEETGIEKWTGRVAWRFGKGHLNALRSNNFPTMEYAFIVMCFSKTLNVLVFSVYYLCYDTTSFVSSERIFFLWFWFVFG